MKTIQEERVKGYFISAAKDLIRGEGLAVVSARNVSERAGYSYATLYNYFKDIRDLIFNCIEDFSVECTNFVATQSSSIPQGKERLFSISKGYVKFFVQYPGIFDLFFQQKASTISTKNSNFNSIYTLFDSLTEEDWKIFISTVEDHMTNSFDVFRDCHKLSIHGLLLMYLNDRVTYSYTELMDKVTTINDCLVAQIKV